MKKLITVLVFSGLLSVPSVVFAEISWYGSVRAGVSMGGGEDAKYIDAGSRWGLKGSNEVSEGLSAVYQFEQGFLTTDASLYTRLANVGLAGGFGTLTLGKIWSASYNAISGPTDYSWLNSATGTSARVGNAVSYAVSAGSVSLQVDAIMDGGKDTGSAIDQLEFGLTFDVTDTISIAFGHTNKRDENVTTTTMSDGYYLVNGMRNDDLEAITVNIPDGLEAGDGASAALNDANTGVTFVDGEAYYKCDADTSTATLPDCTETATIYAEFWIADSGEGGSDTTWDTIYYGEEVDEVPAGMMESTSTMKGSKANHVAVTMALGGLSAYVHHRQTEVNDSNMKDKATRYGVSGGIGDGGLSFYVMARSLDPAVGMKSTPWLAGINKSLGDSATAFVEYGDPDKKGMSGTTGIGLVVNF